MRSDGKRREKSVFEVVRAGNLRLKEARDLGGFEPFEVKRNEFKTTSQLISTPLPSIGKAQDLSRPPAGL
jgi:hypothetical protein